MPTNRKEHLRYRYGICLNDSCSKCKSKEVQQIATRKDLVCEECGKPLRECPPPKSFWNKNGKKIIIVACAVIALGVAALFIGKGKSDAKLPEGPDTTAIDTTNVIEKEPVDTVKTVPIDTVMPEPTDTVKPITVAPVADGKTTAKRDVTSKPKPSVSVPFGTYSGPANGLDGTINVTRHYSLDLRNAAHESLELQPGDVITKTKFKNGELVGGYWQRGSEKRSFHR